MQKNSKINFNQAINVFLTKVKLTDFYQFICTLLSIELSPTLFMTFMKQGRNVKTVNDFSNYIKDKGTLISVE